MVADGSVIACPLALCGMTHEIRADRSGAPYIACKNWKVSVWLNRGVGPEWLEQNNGGAENLALPSHAARRELPRVAKRARRLNPEDPIPDVIDTDDIEADDDSGVALGHCSECGEPLGEHQIGRPCPGCRQPVERVIDAPVSNPSSISNLDADSNAGRCAGCGSPITYGDLNRGTCPGCDEPLTGVTDE